MVFKCRSNTLDIKSHLTYKYTDLKCRKCGCEEETLSHVINCGHEEVLVFDCKNNLTDQANVVRCVRRIEAFLEEVKDSVTVN